MSCPTSLDVVDPVSRLEVRLLGGFLVSINGAELAAERWPSLRAAQLVQLLSLAPRQRMTRDRVIDALWPQLGPDAGAANLRRAAHHARLALGQHDSVLMHGGKVVLWAHGPVDVDADRFAQLGKTSLAAPPGGMREACVQAAGAYGGGLLPGSTYEAWSEPARERLHALFIELLRAGRQWERLALAAPTDEPAHRELMAAELAAGNRAAAIRWYARLREALQQELAITPDRDTEALYDQCVAGLQPAGPTFVGRAMTRARAVASLGMAVTERPGGIVLRGPTGIGKTAFCRELGALARDRGWRVAPPAPASALARGVSCPVSGGVMQALDLEPLADDDARRLVVQAAAGPLSDEVVDHIVRVAAGNPFAAIELARCAAPTGEQSLPHNVAEAILVRLCDVPEAALASLKWMALAGDAFDATTAAALVPDADAYAFAVLDLALAAGVLTLSGTRYRFRHDLVRQDLIEQIPAHRRLKMHRQAAQRLAARGRPRRGAPGRLQRCVAPSGAPERL